MSIAAIALASAMTLLTACGNARAGCEQPHSEGYFRRGSFSAQPEADAVMAERLSQVLQLMGELPLGNGGDAPPVLRVVALPTFGRPRAVRIEDVDSSTPRLVYAQLNGRGGYELGELAERREVVLSTEAVETLRKQASTLRRWLMERAEDEVPGFDGTRWLVEMRTDQGHAVRTIWSPNGSLGSALRAIMSTAGDACTECR